MEITGAAMLSKKIDALNFFVLVAKMLAETERTIVAS